MKTRCRFCLATNAEDYYSVHEEYKNGPTYAEFMHQFVDIERDDGLPQEICDDCYYEVRRMFEFVLGVRKADEELRKELEYDKYKEDDKDQVESLQILENEYFSQIDAEVCVVEEVFELDTDNDDCLVVEEIHDGQDIHLVEEVLDVVTEQEGKSCSQKGDLLVELAHVAATQENVNCIDNNITNTESHYVEDENDEDYLIEFDPNEILNQNLKPPKWKCGECRVVLRGDVSYEGHMNMHKQLRPHKCPHCSNEFRCRTSLKKHQKSRHSSRTSPQPSVPQQKLKTIYFCVECKKHFNTYITLYLHDIVVHKKNEISKTCPFCSNINVGNLKEHIQTYHINEGPSSNHDIASVNSTVWQCYVCSNTFASLELLDDHNKFCHKSDEQHSQELKIEYLDDIPPTTNVDEEYLDVIPSTTNPKNSVESSVQCEICKRKLLRKNFSKHMNLHNRKDKEAQDESRKYLCTRCPREFKNSKSLHQHKKIHEGECSDIVYACGECERQYASEFLLETHRKQAHKERDNICSICGNAFKLKNQLVNHMKLHLEKNIQCPHCEKKYSRQFDLNVHLRSHTGEQPFECHLCDKRFAIKVRLTYHLQRHYGVKHQCKECGAEFNSKQKLKSHSFKHTGMPYRCEMCEDHGFPNRNVFKRHLNRVHHRTISEDALNEMFQQNTGKTVKIKQITEDEKAVVLSSPDIFMETEENLPII